MAPQSTTGSSTTAPSGVWWVNAEEFLVGLARVNIFVGGYGSGKSEVAINFTLSLTGRGQRVSIADLDIVNHYFRSRAARAVLQEHGVGLLLPPVEIMDSDLPLIQPEIAGALRNPDGWLVMDVGGDPVGARVLASLGQWLPEDAYTCFLVLNSRRPFSSSVSDVEKLIVGIEEAAGIRITRLVVNSHLIEETERAVIEEGIRLGEAVSDKTGKPIGFVAIEDRIFARLALESLPYPVLVLHRLLLKPWEEGDKLGPRCFKL